MPRTSDIPPSPPSAVGAAAPECQQLGALHEHGRVMVSLALNPSYCRSGTVIGLPLSATMTASTLAGSVWLALADTACNCPGAS